MTHSSHRWVWNGEGMPWNSLETKQRPRQILVTGVNQCPQWGSHPPPPPPMYATVIEKGKQGKPWAPEDRTEDHLYHSHMHDLGWVPQPGPQFPICNLGSGPVDSKDPCSSDILIHEVTIRGKRNKLRRFWTSRHHHNLVFCLRKLNTSGELLSISVLAVICKVGKGALLEFLPKQLTVYIPKVSFCRAKKTRQYVYNCKSVCILPNLWFGLFF